MFGVHQIVLLTLLSFGPVSCCLASSSVILSRILKLAYEEPLLTPLGRTAVEDLSDVTIPLRRQPVHVTRPVQVNPALTPYRDVFANVRIMRSEHPAFSGWNSELPKLDWKKSIDASSDTYQPPLSTEILVKKPKVLLAMPTTSAQYKSVYQTDSVSQGALDALDRFNKLIHVSRKTSHQIEVSEIGSIQSMKRELMAGDGDMFVLFAHTSDEGKTLHLPNGSSLTVEEFKNICESSGQRLCLVLTCFESDFKIARQISAEDGLRALVTGSPLPNEVALSQADFVNTVRRQIDNFRSDRLHWRFIVVTGVSAGGAVFFSDELPVSSGARKRLMFETLGRNGLINDSVGRP